MIYRSRRLATTWQAYDGTWACQVFDHTGTCKVPHWAESEQGAVQWLEENFPEYDLIEEDVFEDIWRTKSPHGPHNVRLHGTNVKIGQRTTAVLGDKYKPRTRTGEFKLLPGETDMTLIAPVAFAKRINVAPQYIYQAVSKGRIRTTGERPKKFFIKDACRYYGLQIV